MLYAEDWERDMLQALLHGKQPCCTRFCCMYNEDRSCNNVLGWRPGAGACSNSARQASSRQATLRDATLRQASLNQGYLMHGSSRQAFLRQASLKQHSSNQGSLRQTSLKFNCTVGEHTNHVKPILTSGPFKSRRGEHVSSGPSAKQESFRPGTVNMFAPGSDGRREAPAMGRTPARKPENLIELTAITGR
jgi:hypothetical protein